MLIPHTWEWFGMNDMAKKSVDVDPTYVGMIRMHLPLCRFIRGWSHIRGNDSQKLFEYKYPEYVDPTYVGMIRGVWPIWKEASRWSHIRGNDSTISPTRRLSMRLIPHTWEWFDLKWAWIVNQKVDPTYVGMIRLWAWLSGGKSSWSHIRGNDSFWYGINLRLGWLIPHTWEWFG